MSAKDLRTTEQEGKTITRRVVIEKVAPEQSPFAAVGGLPSRNSATVRS